MVGWKKPEFFENLIAMITVETDYKCTVYLQDLQVQCEKDLMRVRILFDRRARLFGIAIICILFTQVGVQLCRFYQ